MKEDKKFLMQNFANQNKEFIFASNSDGDAVPNRSLKFGYVVLRENCSGLNSAAQVKSKTKM
jgi:hypothetical protein